MGYNPVQFNLRLQVPPGQRGPKAFSAQTEYRLLGETNSTVRSGGDLALQDTPSPAAQLEINVSSGHPVLAIHGVVGRTYVIEQIPELFAAPPFNRMWWFVGDVTLTNSPQPFADSTPVATFGRTFYRATVIE